MPRIIDFGVAKATAQPLTDRSLFTESGMLIGTPEYMSPEQAEMTGLDVDTRSDVYALGVLLYELLVGALPFDRQTARSRARRASGGRSAKGAATSEHARDTLRRRRPTDAARIGAPITRSSCASSRRPRLDHAEGAREGPDAPLPDRERACARCSAASERRACPCRSADRRVIGWASLYGGTGWRRRGGVAGCAPGGVLARDGDAGPANRAGTRSRQPRGGAAKQVSEFLVGLFNVSDPARRAGTRSRLARFSLMAPVRWKTVCAASRTCRHGWRPPSGGVHQSRHVRGGRPLLQRALDTQRQVLGHDNAETLRTAHQFANLYWYEGNLQQAEQLYADVVERRRRTLGDEHPETLRASFDLASTYAMQKRWADAERLSAATLAIQQRVLGPEHPDTIMTMGILQFMYYTQERYAEAEPIVVTILERRRRVLGATHPDTLIDLHNLAAIRDGLGRYTQAEAAFLEAIEGLRRVLGENHTRHANRCRPWRSCTFG